MKSLLKKSLKKRNISILQKAKEFFFSIPEFSAGNKAFEKGDFELAIQKYKNATERAPNTADLYNNIAICYIKLNNFSLAKEFIDIAIQKNSNVPEYHENKAKICYFLKNYQEAAINYKNLLKIDPYHSESYLKLCEIYLRLNQPKEAIEILDQILKKETKDGIYNIKKAQIYFNQGDYQLSLKNCEIACVFSPDDHYYRFLKAENLFNLQRYEEALDDIEYSIEIKPTFENYLSRAKILLELKDYEEALKSIDQSNELNPNNDKLYHLKAKILLEMEKYEEGIIEIEKAIKIDPKKEYTYLKNEIVKNIRKIVSPKSE